MSRRDHTPEEKARREKTCELLQLSNIGSMSDIQSLFKEIIAEFMEDGLEAQMATNWVTVAHIQDIYGISVSDSTISWITDKILPIAMA